MRTGDRQNSNPHPAAMVRAKAAHTFSPREFLKQRRPERFSDSVGLDAPVLDRSLLEYHLSTITSRNQEQRFEEFARRLLQKTACPNLLPHTGPTGGGDSKVDTETYPVAPEVSAQWYMAQPNAGAERWAVGISAKKSWRGKIQDDVAKIIGTCRPYTKILFVSSQHIADKKRAEVEDALTKQHGTDLRIFDRQWILDQVFSLRLEELTIEILGIETSVRREVRKGPLDTAREQDFAQVEARIATALNAGQRTSSVVDDSLEAAELARAMEKPRAEVEALYARAERFAQQFGSRHQQVVSAYDRAWTALWWYEDYPLLLGTFREFERRVRGTRNIYELELWTNLIFLLKGAVAEGKLSAKNTQLKRRADALLAALRAVEADETSPSSALQAGTHALFVSLIMGRVSPEHAFNQLSDVVDRAQGLLGYPLVTLEEMCTVWGGTPAAAHPAYEAFFEKLMAAVSLRDGDISAARMLLSRGAQHLERDKNYDAIRVLGRALGLLYKNETRDELVRALYLAARAYENVGLLWAARGSLLTAASIATRELWTHESVRPPQALCCNRVKWIELRLGRLPHVLAWHQLDRALRGALQERGYPMTSLAEREDVFDAILAILLLRTDVADLRKLSTIPAVLTALELHMSEAALLFALGHEDELAEAKEHIAPDTLTDWFLRLTSQPAGRDIPAKPLLSDGPRVELSTKVLGCQIAATVENTSPCIETAESVLAALESLLATGIVQNVMPREPQVTINVRHSDFADALLSIDTSDRDGRSHVEIVCKLFNANSLKQDDQVAIKDKLFEVVTFVMIRTFAISEQVVTTMFRDDLAAQRALNFTGSFIVTGNMLGHEPRTTLAYWQGMKDASDYPPKRGRAWDYGLPRPDDKREDSKPPRLRSGEAPPPELMRPDRMKHNEIEVISVIREALWNEAQWCGTGIATIGDPEGVPYMALLFRNLDAAHRIFEFWVHELSGDDTAGKLHISILRHIDRHVPHAYRVIVSANPVSMTGDNRTAILVCRTNTMEPASSENLDRFLRLVNKHQHYYLTYGTAEQFGSIRIRKAPPVVREAWTVGLHEFEAMGIRADDDPIIPDGHVDVPVQQLLARRRSIQG